MLPPLRSFLIAAILGRLLAGHGRGGQGHHETVAPRDADQRRSIILIELADAHGYRFDAGISKLTQPLWTPA